jgi:hypothetical protein
MVLLPSAVACPDYWGQILGEVELCCCTWDVLMRLRRPIVRPVKPLKHVVLQLSFPWWISLTTME